MAEQTFAELLEEYAALAAYIDDKEAELKVVKKARDNVKVALMAQMNQIGMAHTKSKAGHSVTLVTNYNGSIVDAEAFFKFVFESGNTDMLTKRVATEAVQDYLAVTNQLPPGVQLTSAQTMRFNRAK